MSRLPLVSPLDRALFLKAQPYLDGLPPRSLAALAEYTEEVFLTAGQHVYLRGVPPDKLYFLVTGGIRTEYAGAPGQELLAPAGLGLIEYLAQSPEPPAVRTIEDTMALVLDTGSFMQIMEDEFAHYVSIATQLSRALREALERWGPKRPSERGFAEDHLQETFATLDLVQRLAQAREAPFFRGSNLTVMTELLRFQEPRVLRAGELLFEEGDAVDSMALVLDGTFLSANAGGETLHPAGSMVGAWEIFSRRPRSETTRAVSPARVIEIDGTLFTDLLEDHFEFAVDYLRKLSRRLLELRFSVPAEASQA